ncbi:cell division protein FtsA [Anaeromonas frigoriresistens]|nr:cell division FtsA domain-containing protein [Anaeromonas frigoriresistens]
MDKITSYNELDDLIFSLDIGTRTVIGIVGKYDGEHLIILDSEIKEHSKRNMYDGQIHDINGVVEIVNGIKSTLEKRLDIKLEKVGIAAAGRALKTHKVRLERNSDISREIDKRIMESLEMEAIQKAQKMIDTNEEKNKTSYYCVGYSVMNYLLDGNYIDNLEGHKGHQIGVEAIATFLPHVVVDSLYTVMDRVGLEVINMTLEPIAAINVAIKKSLRLLNLALVDIGAGTSDIAITKDGAIIAYGMAAVAGDEITEAIAKKYLLDFEVAEGVKTKLNSLEEQSFIDVIGMEHEIKSSQILNDIKDTIESLAKEITQAITQYNEKPPSAVFLIGGGSQIPMLDIYIADNLGIPKERVVVRDTSIIENVQGINEKLSGPNAITPIGIAMTAIDTKYKDFLELKINGQSINLLNSKTLKVSDALILIGYNPRKLIPKRGKAIQCFINGEIKTIPGELGDPAVIYINNKRSNLDSKLNNGDIINILDATEGKKTEPKLFDIVDKSEYVYLEGVKEYLIKDIYINGNKLDGNIKIKENDRIDINRLVAIDDIIKSYKNIVDIHDLKVNNKFVTKGYKLKHKDVIEINKKSSKNNISLIINDEEKNFSYDKKDFIFVDIFNYIDFDLSKPKGHLHLTLNGERADYHQRLTSGDVIEIYWKNN